MRAAVALIALTLAGCTPAPVTKVREILAHCDSYKGKIVRVAGYLGECGGYSCHVFADRAHARAFDAGWAELARIGRVRDANGDPDHAAQEKVLARLNTIWPMGVGFNAGVEPRLTAHGGRYVIITGRIDKDSCDGQGGMDRSPGLHPTDVRVWTKAAGAPADADDNAPFRPSTTLH